MSIKPCRRHRARTQPGVHRDADDAPDPRLLRAVRHAVLLGLALLLAWPAMRGYNPWLGWGPLWLLGMPLASWWALNRFRMPRAPLPARASTARRRPRSQARRLRLHTPAPVRSRAA